MIKFFYSHDLKGIFNKCNENNLFAEIKVSDDFFRHMNYHFQRYPSQIRRIVDASMITNDTIGNSIDWISYYDDLIIQLDNALFQRTKDTSISLIYHSLRTLETRYARDILFQNAAALLAFEEYSIIILGNMPNRADLQARIRENLSKGAIYYWDPTNKVITFGEIKKIKNEYSVATFQLPRWETINGHLTTLIP